APVMPAFGDEWGAPEDTDPEELSSDALEPVDEDAETGLHQVRRLTIESPIPKLLATMTDPEWKPPGARDEAAPEAELFDEDTRRLGSEPHNTSSGRVPGLSETLADDEAREVRLRAA